MYCSISQPRSRLIKEQVYQSIEEQISQGANELINQPFKEQISLLKEQINQGVD
jgi:hypothetical protein